MIILLTYLSALVVSSVLPLYSSPYFTSSPGSYQVVEGEKVLLTCMVEDLGDSTLIWKKEGRMISAGDLLIRKDPRMKLIRQSLEISEVTEDDAGEYICNVETVGDPLDQQHTVTVLVAPSIESVPEDGNIVVHAGAGVTIQCRARGDPSPRISWSWQNQHLPAGVEEQQDHALHVAEVGRQHAGLYRCTAENGLGIAVDSSIQLVVLDHPQVSLALDWVRYNKQVSAQLSCHVQAEPLATVRWYKDTMLLLQTDRRRMEVFSNKHVLHLSRMEQEDFGNYSCNAENSVGVRSQTVEVCGHPQPARIISKEVSMYRNNYRLEWMVDSIFEIIETRILYRSNKDELSDWTNVILTNKQERNMSSFTFTELTPSTEYEVIIQSRNKEGWSEPSHIFQFRTTAEDLQLTNTWRREMFSSHSYSSKVDTKTVMLCMLVMVGGGV